MATDKLQVFKCEICGNMVEVIHGAGGTLKCCGQAMNLLQEGVTDAATEKHLPVIEKIEGGYRVKVGDVAHPMEDKHWVEWIELIADGKACRQFLYPGEAPEAMFMIDAGNVSAREYCNLHGLWRA